MQSQLSLKLIHNFSHCLVRALPWSIKDAQILNHCQGQHVQDVPAPVGVLESETLTAQGMDFVALMAVSTPVGLHLHPSWLLPLSSKLFNQSAKLLFPFPLFIFWLNEPLGNPKIPASQVPVDLAPFALSTMLATPSVTVNQA